MLPILTGQICEKMFLYNSVRTFLDIMRNIILRTICFETNFATSKEFDLQPALGYSKKCHCRNQLKRLMQYQPIKIM